MKDAEALAFVTFSPLMDTSDISGVKSLIGWDSREKAIGSGSPHL